jgi:hypothetical protein
MSRRLRSAAVALISAGLTLAGLGQLQQGDEMGGFRVPEYEKDGTLKTLLRGERARAIDDHQVEIDHFRIDLYKNGEVETRVTGPHALYYTRAKKAESTNEIRIARGNMVISGTGYEWDGKSQRFEIRRNAKVIIRDLHAQMGRKKGTPP